MRFLQNDDYSTIDYSTLIKQGTGYYTNCHLFNGRSSVLRSLCTSVEVNMELEHKALDKQMAAGGKNETLYQRLSALGSKRGYVAQTINEYVRQGRAARNDNLDRCIKELRRYRKHHLALEIFDWMEKSKINFVFTDQARCICLTAKVHGIAAAENYFDRLSPSKKNLVTYGAILNCYCNEMMAEKACDTFAKMDEMAIGHALFTFGSMMSLCMRLRQPEKVLLLVLDMKKRGIQPSTFTYNVRMCSYSSLNDIQGVERVFEEIKNDGGTQCDWTTYNNLADANVKAGLNEKAELAAKEFEQMLKAGCHAPEAYGWLITLYAEFSNHDGVHRVWKSLKPRFTVISNMNYLTMIQALIKLNDIEGMKKWFEEWESMCSYYDTRLVNSVLGAYIKRDMIEEAKTILNRARERSDGPFSIAWEMLMAHYLNKGQMEQALECLEAATSGIDGSHSEWYPRSENVSKFLSFFEEEKDADGAEKLCKYLRKLKPLDSDLYKMLLQTYIGAGRTATGMRKRMEEDGVELSLELENLLQNVCPELWTSSLLAKLSTLKSWRFYGSSLVQLLKNK